MKNEKKWHFSSTFRSYSSTIRIIHSALSIINNISRFILFTDVFNRLLCKKFFLLDHSLYFIHGDFKSHEIWSSRSIHYHYEYYNLVTCTNKWNYYVNFFFDKFSTFPRSRLVLQHDINIQVFKLIMKHIGTHQCSLAILHCEILNSENFIFLY